MKKTIIIIASILVVLVITAIILYNILFIGKKEVKEIIIKDANISMNDVKRWNIEFNFEEGMFIYDVEVVYNNQEYNYEINAKNGDIILSKMDN